MLSEQQCQRASKQIIIQQEFENAILLVFWKAMTTTSAKWWERCNNGRLTACGSRSNGTQDQRVRSDQPTRTNKSSRGLGSRVGGGW